MRIVSVRNLLSAAASLLPSRRPVTSAPLDALEAECELDAAFDAAALGCTELTLMVLRLDGLAALGQRYGSHTAGQLLSSFTGCAGLLLDHPFVLIRQGDGECFCLLPGTSAEVALSIGETIRSRFAGTMTLTTVGPIFVTASVGVASSRHFGFDVDRLRTAARHALDEAAALGGNRVIQNHGAAPEQSGPAHATTGASTAGTGWSGVSHPSPRKRFRLAS